ncbi:IS481 family transposase [Streptomyces sp. LX-29]|uniref:IS481 family transposase n=1 Tax=Streptomyces sp. LX-29 TaxID=2900152 RepID=UPI00240E6844|nr:IS481 family transposase [Streptomyces sp. LX-29]WFB05610.1 IS481 family transposase [Streptomyces sp. LX-29]
MEKDAVDQRHRDWLVEQRYRAVLEVLNGAPVTEVAVRYGVSRQSIYTWKAKHAAGGFAALKELSRRPRSSPTRLPAEVEALACEMRRAHPRWGARRIAHELARAGVPSPPSRATVHRVLVRNGLVRRQKQQHRRKYKRWQREAPMHLWQLDLVGGIFLADGRECKMLTGIDDHSRFVVVAEVLAVPSGRAVADAFVRAMRTYGVPAEVLTDNGKQFTGRFTRTGPTEVLFERVCRENGVTSKLTKPYSPTTTGKIERWHLTLRRELLDASGPFLDLPTAQNAITEWVHAYNHSRPHQALEMATPASLFRPASQPETTTVIPRPRQAAAKTASPTADPAEPLLMPSAGALEFDTVVAASGQLAVLPSVQRIKIGAAHGGQRAHVWVDEYSVHVFVAGQLVKTVPSNLDADDLHTLRLRGARPAGPPPATAAAEGLKALPDYAAVDVDRSLDHEGKTTLGGQKIKIGAELAKQRVTLRLDGHLLHVIHEGLLAKTLPSPLPADTRRKLHGARVADTELPATAPGPISVERKVPRDGVVMVARQRLRVGRTYAGKIVTIYVEDTHFRVTLDGAELALHHRKDQHPVTRWKAKIHAPKT